MDKKITIFEKKELNYDENEFMTLHNKIIETGQMATVYIYEMAKLLKEMHDSKKYIVAGFESFEAYTESQLNIKKSQAYKYINIVETFSIEFFHSSGKNMGVSKLALLANLTEDGSNEFIEHHDFKNSMKKFFDNNSNASKEDKQHFYNSQRYHANESNKYAWSNKYSDNKKEHYHFRVFEEQKQKGRLLTDEERKKIYNENNEFWDDVKKTTDRVMKSKGLYKI